MSLLKVCSIGSDNFLPPFRLINEFLEGRNLVLLKRSIYQAIFDTFISKNWIALQKGLTAWTGTNGNLKKSGEYGGWGRIFHFTRSKYFLTGFATCGLILSCSRISLLCLLFHSGRFVSNRFEWMPTIGLKSLNTHFSNTCIAVLSTYKQCY